MKAIVALILAFVALASLAYLAVVNFPRTQEISYDVSKPVWEQRIRTIKKMVEVRGEMVEVEFDVPYKVAKMVPEERTTTIPPRAWDYLVFAVIVLAIVVVAGFAFVILVALARNKWSGGRETEDTKDTRRQAERLISFALGILVGVVGGNGLLETPSQRIRTIERSVDADLGEFDDSSVEYLDHDALDANFEHRDTPDFGNRRSD
jgi:hypothetical protein